MEIRRGNYDVVLVHGYQYAAHLIAFAAARSKHLPIIVRSETHLGLRRSAWRQTARDATVSVLYRFVDAFLAIGTANHAYYRSIGIREEKIFDAPYAVDNSRFTAGARLDDDFRAKLRQKYHLPLDAVVVLYASRFVRRKHPETVIRAVDALQSAGQSVTLFMVGSGEIEPELRRLASGCQAGTIVFGGFVNQTELPHIYGASDIFVLPAESEPWGLAVNEAMCAGLPIVVSGEVGCAADLVREGINGYLVKAGNVSSLVKVLETLVANPSIRQGMGAASRALIDTWSYEECRRGFSEALRYLLSEHRLPASASSASS
jgi:glycosyltransferase involved in cell wall biosynthesis